MNELNNHLIMIMNPQHDFLEWAIQLDSAVFTEKNPINLLDTTAVVLPDKKMHNSLSVYLMEKSEILLAHEFGRWSKDENNWPFRCDLEALMNYFKLEFYNKIINFEKTLSPSQKLFILKPTIKLHEWLKNAFVEMGENPTLLSNATLDIYASNATGYLLPNSIQSTDQIRNFMREIYKSIFEYELHRYVKDSKYWPSMRNYNAFEDWFIPNLHPIFILD